MGGPMAGGGNDSLQAGSWSIKEVLNPEAGKRAVEAKSWRSPMEMADWRSLAQDPEDKVKAALWAMKIGASKQELFFELVRKLRDTMQHAEDMLGKELKISLTECYAPVMFLMNAWEEFTVSQPFAVRDIALEDGAKPVSKATLREVDRFLEFADAAYDTLEGESLVEFVLRKGFTLVYHDASTDYEMAAHYVAFHPREKLAVISVKGTSTVSDVLTDILCRAEPFLPNTYAHEGMRNAARRIVARVHSFIDSLLGPTGYRIVVTGHSLGAGVATLVAMILKEEVGFANVRAYAYACPPVLDREAALKCKDYVIAVVNDRDVICRTSLSNMNIQHEVLLQTNEMLKEGTLSKANVLALNGPRPGADEENEQAGRSSEVADPLERAQAVGDTHAAEEAGPQVNVLAMLRSIQERYKLAYEKDLYVAGRVIYLFRTAGGRFDVVEGDGTLTGLRQMLLCKTMLSDHGVAMYKGAITDVLMHKHYCHSVMSPAILRDTPGTHMSIDGWSRFRNPAESFRQVTFYEISTVVVRDSRALEMQGADALEASQLEASSADRSGLFGFVDHVMSRFTAWRRYNDFVALDSRMRNSGLDTPSLPSKFAWRSPSERAPLLLDYLNSVSVRVVKKGVEELVQVVLDFVGAGAAPKAPHWVLAELAARARASHSEGQDIQAMPGQSSEARARVAKPSSMSSSAAGAAAGQAPVERIEPGASFAPRIKMSKGSEAVVQRATESANLVLSQIASSWFGLGSSAAKGEDVSVEQTCSAAQSQSEEQSEPGCGLDDAVENSAKTGC